MNYKSTRDGKVSVSAAKAIAQGISKDGGLFVPESRPRLTNEDFAVLKTLSYPEKAKYILKYFLTDFTDEELDYCVRGAYIGNFENDAPAPLKKTAENKYFLELWHGPTCAFKDLALRLLPYLLTTSVKKLGSDKETVILVATSGDTGKAALEGFRDVKGTKIIVFYPNDGVSAMQKRQMNTQKGENVFVSAIVGNFDDAQTGVKKIFTDNAVAEKLAENGFAFSSANSINWGRLVPQIVYYVSAYCDLLNSGADLKDGFNVTVPTGNFGNILAAYYAREMGVPINRLICASNENNVLTDFINTGKYNARREFHTTISPSMDILISSNLERMLFELYGHDSDIVADLQRKLSETGEFSINDEALANLKKVFSAGCCDDKATVETIGKYFKENNYLIDTHTAVAARVADDYAEKTGDKRPMVVVSTASPYKFSSSVLKAVAPDKCGDDEFKMVEALHNATGVKVPETIAELEGLPERFSNVCEKQDMLNVVYDYLFKDKK